MTASRTPLFEQNNRTPRGQLDKRWRQTTPLASTAVPARMLDENMSDLHEEIAKLKQWADGQHAKTGIYPDDVVQKFLAKFS